MKYKFSRNLKELKTEKLPIYLEFLWKRIWAKKPIQKDWPDTKALESFRLRVLEKIEETEKEITIRKKQI